VGLSGCEEAMPPGLRLALSARERMGKG